MPLLSSHDTSPGPFVPSLHENEVGTDCPTVYVPPDAGDEIDADGAVAVKYVITTSASPAALPAPV